MSSAPTTSRPPVQRNAGLSLLELLVSITLLAAISLIVASLWAQTADWSSENRLFDDALRPQRVHDLMRDQWRRRAAAPAVAPDETGPVRLVDARFDFMTTLPVLFPEAPLVRASYRIEPESAPSASSGGAGEFWQLVYEERRVLDPGEVRESDRDSTGAPLAERIVVLDGCESLGWEWARVRRDEPPRSLAAGRGAADAPQAQAPEPVVMPGTEVIEWLPPLTEAERLAANKEEPGADGRQRMLGVRLRGQRGKEAIGWTIIVEDSR